MPRKLFYVVLALALSAAAGVVLAALEWAPFKVALGCAVVVAFAAWWWHGELMRGVAYTEFSYASRRAMAYAITVAVTLHCIWLVWTLADQDEWRTHALRLLVLSAVELAVAAAWHHRLTTLVWHDDEDAANEFSTDVEVYEPELIDAEAPHLRPADEYMQAILNHGGWPYVLVTRFGLLPDGHQGAAFECRALTAAAASEFAGKSVDTVKALKPGDEEALAQAAEEVLRIDLETRWVRIQATERPGRVRVTIAAEDILAKAHPYPLTNELVTHRGPITIGAQIHGDPAHLNPYQHGVIIGPTKSGKTSLVNVVFAELMRRPGRLSVCGTEKVYDLVGQWLDVHIDTDNDLPFDSVAVGIDDTLMLLAEAFLEARWRQNLPHDQRQRLDPWWIFIEEAPAVLRNNTRTIEVEGVSYNASALVAHMKRTITSSDMYLCELSQEFDNAMFGDAAASIKGNSGYRILMRSQDSDERSRALGKGAAALPDLQHSGELYIKDNCPPYAAKSRYIQEMDIRKERLHEGADIATVSIARSQLVAARSGGQCAPPSPWYADRPRRMTIDYRSYLQGQRSLPAGGTRSSLPELASSDPQSLVEEMIREVEAELEQRDRLQVTETDPKRGLRQQIVDLVHEAGREMTRKEIGAAFPTVSESSLDNHLSKLVQQGKLCRPSPGLYAPADTD